MAFGKTQLLPESPTATPNNSYIESSSTAAPPHPRRSKTLKFLAILAIIIIVDVLIFVALDLTVLRARTPKYRLNSVTVDGLTINNATASPPSFNIKLTAEAAIGNKKNYGPYKYETGYLSFFYRGVPVGEVSVVRARAKARSSRKLDYSFNVSSIKVAGDSRLRSDLDSGILEFTGESELRGQVEVFKINKKDKKVKLKCSFKVNLGDKAVQDLICE